jgi:ubiquinone/menaquinone biosynthesis C-methylase UbiE
MLRYPAFIFRALYWYLNKLDKEKQLTFMNYGFSENGEKIKLDPEDEKNRYCVQLYHHLCQLADIDNKDIVEVGSGRGGGMAYIAKTWNPSSMIGVDLAKGAVAFSNNHHARPNLRFIAGNAQQLPLKDNSCDVLLNVESSHRYLLPESFLGEVKRVLRPGGFFLFTDFRLAEKWPVMLNILERSGLNLIFESDVTQNVLDSLDKDSERRIELVKRFVPKILQKEILNFTGAKGTETYNAFHTRRFIYKTLKMQKPTA